jgi:hypothetical protein
VARGEKLLERMRANPRDWRIEDVRTLRRAYELDFDKPASGSHYSGTVAMTQSAAQFRTAADPAQARPERSS